MSDISQFETRISSALERIGRAVALAEERADSAVSDEGGIASEEMVAEVGRLNEALEHEKDNNAQMEERVRAIHEKQQSFVASLEEEVEQLRRQLMDHDGEMQKMRSVNAQLRANNTQLREANAEGVSDPNLVNVALMGELDAIKVVRDADALELDVILTELNEAVAANASATEPATGEI